MDKRFYFISALSILFVAISFFGPFVIVNNEAIPTYFALFCTNFTLINAIFILGYLLLLGGVFSYLFKHKNDLFVYNSFFFFIIGGFIFAFASPLMEFVLNTSVVYISATPIILATLSFVFALYILYSDKPKSLFTVKDIVEIAMLISLAVILDMFLKIKIGATGGSINLAMLPLMIIALRHNFYKSFIATGLVYGLTTCLTDGYGLMYLPFDYVLGFGSVALISLFRTFILNNETDKMSVKGIIFLFISCICVFVFRTLASTISSMVYYGYTFSAGIIYNITYIGPSVAACFALLILLYKPLLMVNKRYSSI